MNPLPMSFYKPSAKVVARKLLGHYLVRRTPEGYCGGEIVETEAYLVGDPACHAYPGETKRNRVMWGEPGRGYVYLIYGFYHCFNTVCRPAGEAEAVLVRAVEAKWGIPWMLGNRPVEQMKHLTSGPGKLCVAISIDRRHDGVNLCEDASEIYVAENPEVASFRRKNGPVIVTTRIGINVGADLPLRFYLDKSEFVSKRAKRLITS